MVVGERRPGWHTLWMSMAQLMALRGTCLRRHVGAVAVTADNQMIATGYNGAPRGLPHCAEVGCEMEDQHCIRAVHAESNVILQAARLGVALDGATLYVTVSPCIRCALQIVQAGIKYVHYDSQYRGGEDFLRVVQTLQRADVGIFGTRGIQDRDAH